MPSANKYGSITETFLGNPFVLINPLSGKATPPVDLIINNADTTAVTLWSGTVNFKFDHFRLGDVPRLVGVGIWCNLADGLVQADVPDDDTTGLIIGIGGKSYNQGNVEVQSNIIVPNAFYKVQEFNQTFETDQILDVSALNYNLTGKPGFGTGYYILNAYIRAVSMRFSTISLDPLYAAKPLYMRPMVVIEHTYPVFS